MSEELPEGWVETTLRDAVTKLVDGSHNPPPKQEAGIPMLSARNIEGGRILFNDFRRITPDAFRAENARTRVATGDVLLTIVGSIGRVAVVRDNTPQFALQRSVAVFSPRGLEPDFFARQLEAPSIQRALEDAASGTAQRGVYLRTLAELPLHVAPLQEQRRIVTQVEALLEQVNRAKGRLERVSSILKRFRQAVLAAACSGELTREWRDEHRPVEPADALVAEVARLRRTRGLPSAARTIPDEGIEIPDVALPESWTWCRVGEIADVRLGGTPSRKDPTYWNGSVPWVSSGEVANCRIAGTAERITKSGLENSNAKLYPAGSVLIAMIGEGKTRGQSAILDIEAATNQNAAGLVFDVGLINSEYIWYWALQEYAKNRDEGRGGNQAALNGAKVRALPVPLPPVEEQIEIVRVLQKLLALADTIERRVTAATARAEKLPQAILSKAFSGELVPTEAELARAEGRTYESAAEFLKRASGDRIPTKDQSGHRRTA